ncbi:MAG: hypothetical protein J3K34DRAFT_429903 [Monoraphidium minutum]|nr:MAG: hypothetical protein J3K34DRAFT_429903 [Monoraphidium minutum]
MAPLGDVAELAAAVEGEDQYDLDMEQLAEVVDPDVAMPRELVDFLRLFEKGTPRDLGKLEAAREKVGFRRGADGRVSLISDGGEEFSVKADMQAPGYLLLRDARGYCYYLPADPSGRLAQIDLSDDVLVAQLFANGMWEDVIEPLEVMAAPEGANASADGALQLRLSEDEFRGVVSLLQGAAELPEEPLEDLLPDDARP